MQVRGRRDAWRGWLPGCIVPGCIVPGCFVPGCFVLGCMLIGNGHLSAQQAPLTKREQPDTREPREHKQRLERVVAALLRSAPAGGHWGVSVASMDGTPLLAIHAGQFFRPASNAKLFTTAAAMALLGPDSRAETSLSWPTADAAGTVIGDLTVAGLGDANLSGRVLPYVPPDGGTAAADPLAGVSALVEAVLARGVRHITGGVTASDLWEPYPQGWGTDDLLWGYGAPVSSLAFDDNQVKLTVTAGQRQADPALVTLTPDLGFYTVVARVLIADQAASSVQVYRDPGSRVVYVDGLVAPGTPYTAELAIDDPPLYAAMALRAALIAHGVAVDGAAKSSPREHVGDPDLFLQQSRAPIALDGRGCSVGSSSMTPTTVVRHESVPLRDDVVVTLKESLNLHAEMMLRRLPRAACDVVSMPSQSYMAEGARVERQWLLDAGLGADEFVFFDGSGLSDKDLVTPHAVTQLLVYAARQPWFAVWRAGLPVGGVDGSLAHRFGAASGLRGRVFAKTGTLGEATALSGYVVGASGRTVAFSILADTHLPGTAAATRGTIDRIVAAIAAAQ